MIFGEFVQNGSEVKGQMCPLQKALRLLLLSGICALSTQQMCAAGSEANVTFVPGQTLLAEIGKAPGQDHGISLMSYVRAPGYSATVVRRTRAGSAEVHKNVDDVWYVIAGGGTLVTGGSLVAARETEAGELRGQAVSAGTPRRIGKGDFISIPAGIPHWVSAIEGKEIVYLVVKIKEAPHAR